MYDVVEKKGIMPGSVENNVWQLYSLSFVDC